MENNKELQETVSAEAGHKPFTLEIDAAAPYAEQADFSVAHWKDHHKKLRYKKTNIFYLHTFKWTKEHPHDTIVSAKLIVDMVALSSAGPNRKSDKIAIVGPGGIQMGHYMEAAYTASVNRPVDGCSSVLTNNGKEVRKTWNITGVALQRLNENGTLSITIGDDTYVKSATLTIEGNRH